MKLMLVRHGETQENIDGIVQGWKDTHLNKLGHKQAKLAAEHFSETIDAIISSNLSRCRETAQYFRNTHPRVPYSEDARLCERGFGDAEGAHKDDQDWETFWALKEDVSIPNAEPLVNFSSRIDAFLHDLRKKHPNNACILVVTHGGVINEILKLLKIQTKWQQINNGEIITIDI